MSGAAVTSRQDLSGHGLNVRPEIAIVSLSAALLGFGLVLGGATRSGTLGEVILQILAVALLATVTWHRGTWLWRDRRACLVVPLAVLAVVLATVVPLPSWVWTALPGRALAAEGLELIGAGGGWRPISLTPGKTLDSLVTLMPPLALFLAGLTMAQGDRRLLAGLVVALAGLNIVVGFAQVMQGGASPLRFHAFTNTNEAVGFFANRNHFSALLYCTIPLGAALLKHAVLAAPPSTAGRSATPRTLYLAAAVVGIAAILVVLAGLAASRSRAGLVLGGVAIFGAVAVFVARRPRLRELRAAALIGGGAALVGMFVLQFAVYRIVERFTSNSIGEDARNRLFSATLSNIWRYQPFGSGLGSFAETYATFEKPEDLFVYSYVNHVHNDGLELVFELGIPALLMIGAGLAWFVLQARRIWAVPPQRAEARRDPYLARAATIVLTLLALHSLVDYPLRTTTLMLVAALCIVCLLAGPDARPALSMGGLRSLGGRLPRFLPESKRPSRKGDRAAAAPRRARESAPMPPQPFRPVIDDAAWPDEWRAKPPVSKAADDPGR